MPTHEGKKPGQLFVLPKEELRHFRKLTPEEAARFRETKKEKKKKQPETGETTIERAAELMGKDYLGPDAVEQTFGVRLESHEIPPVPFTEAELERAKELGQFLILRIDHAPDGKPLTMEKMNDLLEQKFKSSKKGKILNDTDWYKNESFFTTDTPPLRWALVSREVIPNSTSKNYLEQTEALAVYLKDHVFRDQELPKAYEEAITEFEAEKQKLATLVSTDWEKAVERFSNLTINQLSRHAPVEVLYDLLMYFEQNGRLLENLYTWTSRRSSRGGLVDVGRFVTDGARVSGWGPDYVDDRLGVSFSRSL